MANQKLRTKSGALRKGVTQSDVAKRAQKELKLMKRGTRTGKRRPIQGPKRILVVLVVADGENTRATSSNCRVYSEQNSKRAEVTPKGFEEVINAKQEVLE